MSITSPTGNTPNSVSHSCTTSFDFTLNIFQKQVSVYINMYRFDSASGRLSSPKVDFLQGFAPEQLIGFVHHCCLWMFVYRRWIRSVRRGFRRGRSCRVRTTASRHSEPSRRSAARCHFTGWRSTVGATGGHCACTFHLSSASPSSSIIISTTPTGRRTNAHYYCPRLKQKEKKHYKWKLI